VVFYNRLAEIAGEYLKKGSKVYVEGSLRTRKWQDKNSGADRYTTEIIANEMQMLDGRGGGGGGEGDGERSGQAQSAPAAREPAPAGADDFDDDIPF